MKVLTDRLEKKDWTIFIRELSEKGFSIMPDVLTNKECDQIKEMYNQKKYYRKTVSMEQYRFGKGEYKYFTYPLPKIIEILRHRFYRALSPLANLWMQTLKMDQQYPEDFTDFLQFCHSNGQKEATVLILEYQQGGYNTMHQDLYGNVFFPIQIVISLDQAGIDYTGGEFILSEQKPRSQARINIIKPNKGDILAFPTQFRPVQTIKGYYRSNIKHGVGTIHKGNRHTLGIIFHDAK